MFQAPKLTNAGKALYYDNMAGTQLKFTTIKLGNGTLSGPIANLTNLVNTVVTINAVATPYEDYANVAGAFSNASLAEGFYWREIGVFAANPSDPDNRAADILYCYQNAYDTADFIPVASVETVEKNITVPAIVGDATAVSCTLSKSLVFVTQQDLEAQKGAANGVASLDANGKITPSQVDYLLKSIVAAADYDPTATYAAGAYCIKAGTLYKCTTPITVAEAWTAAHWAETTVEAEFRALYAALAGKLPLSGGRLTGNLEIANGNGYLESGLFNGYGFLKLHAVNGADSTRIQIETGADRDPFIERVINGVSVSSVRIATAMPPDDISLPLENGISNIMGHTSTFGKDQFGKVYINLLISHVDASPFTLWGEVAAILPIGCRPKEVSYKTAFGVSPESCGIVGIDINPNGAIHLYPFAPMTQTSVMCAFEIQAESEV